MSFFVSFVALIESESTLSSLDFFSVKVLNSISFRKPINFSGATSFNDVSSIDIGKGMSFFKVTSFLLIYA